MNKFSYDYVEAKNEQELKKKLVILQAKTGYTYRVINIYPSKNKVVCWYYSDRRMSNETGN